MVISPITIGGTSTDAAATGSGGCGCGGCGCGAGESGETAEKAPASTSTTAPIVQVGVEGMTCGHCVSAVTEELGSVPGVTGISIDLVAGGLSTVTLRTDGPVADADIRAAVEEAGYQLAGRA